MPLSNSENKKYLKEKERLLTFKSWPKEDIVKSAILAADGFIYLNEGDRVMCVFCQGVLRTWEPNDSPSEEHDRHFPHCPYVLGYDVGNIPLSCNYRRKPSLGKPPNIKIPKEEELPLKEYKNGKSIVQLSNEFADADFIYTVKNRQIIDKREIIARLDTIYARKVMEMGYSFNDVMAAIEEQLKNFGTDFKNLKEFVSAAEKMKNKKKDFTEKLESLEHLLPTCYMAPRKERNTSITVGNITLNEEDLKILNNNDLLNDKIIDSYMQLIMWLKPGEVFSLSCQVGVAWRFKSYEEWFYDKVQFSSFKYIIAPLCCGVDVTQYQYQYTGSHWVLLVADVRNNTVSILNSVPGSYQKEEKTFLDEWKQYMKLRCDKIKEPKDLKNWVNKEWSSSKQQDGASCGIFVLMNAEAIARDIAVKRVDSSLTSKYRAYVYNRLFHEEKRKNICRGEICRKPMGPQDWIQCENCLCMSHVKCVNLNKKLGVYYCYLCIKRR